VQRDRGDFIAYYKKKEGNEVQSRTGEASKWIGDKEDKQHKVCEPGRERPERQQVPPTRERGKQDLDAQEERWPSESC